jgi:hypothetical protein
MLASFTMSICCECGRSKIRGRACQRRDRHPSIVRMDTVNFKYNDENIQKFLFTTYFTCSTAIWLRCNRPITGAEGSNNNIRPATAKIVVTIL